MGTSRRGENKIDLKIIQLISMERRRVREQNSSLRRNEMTRERNEDDEKGSTSYHDDGEVKEWMNKPKSFMNISTSFISYIAMPFQQTHERENDEVWFMFPHSLYVWTDKMQIRTKFFNFWLSIMYQEGSYSKLTDTRGWVSDIQSCSQVSYSFLYHTWKEANWFHRTCRHSIKFEVIKF